MISHCSAYDIMKETHKTCCHWFWGWSWCLL